MKRRTKNDTMTFRSSAEVRALYRAERRVKKSGLGRIIASRVLREENARNDRISVLLGAPRRVEAHHWLCPFRILGIVESDIKYGYGVDGVQALFNALAGIRILLDRTNRRFLFLGSDHGFPRQIPTEYGEKFEERVGRAIDRESKRVEFDRMRELKAEIAAAETRLTALKKDVARHPQPGNPELKREIASEIARRTAIIKTEKKRARSWEAELRK